MTQTIENNLLSSAKRIFSFVLSQKKDLGKRVLDQILG